MLLTCMSRILLFGVKHAVLPRFLHIWTSCWKYIIIYIYVIVPIPVMVITYGHCRSLARVNACLMVSYCWCVFNGYQNNLQLEEVGICWIHCVHMNKWQIWNSHINNQVMKIYTYILVYRKMTESWTQHNSYENASML